MPLRSRSRLLAFAVAAFVFACAAPSAHARLDGPPRREPPKPTVGQRAAKVALRAVGVPYRWGGSSPSGGFDCSGLVYWAYSRLGVRLAHSSYALHGLGRRVPRSRLRAGDVLFFSGLGHVGVYVGRGRMVHAPQSGQRVEVVRLSDSYYARSFVGARRMIRR
jgi:cell wall-associated NlpC family hydrolase